MGFKALFGLTVVPAAIVGGCVMACVSRRIRDLFFVLLVFLSPMIERVDVNFVSREWYRGTSRGFEFSILDILSISLLVSAVLFPRRGEARWYWPASLGLMILLFLYACGNVAALDPKLFGCFELFRMVRGLILVLAVAFHVRGEREVRQLIIGLAMLVCFEGLLALKQRYIDGIHRVPGTIDDSNSLSVFLCMTAPVLVAAVNSRLTGFVKMLCGAGIALACVAEILTISRAGVIILGAMLGGTAAVTMSYRVTFRKIALCCLIVLGAAGLLAKSWKTLGDRFHESTLSQEYGNHHNLGRGYYIRVAAAIVDDHWFGIGLNNWSYRVSNEYGPKLGYRFVPYRGTDKEPSTVIPSNSNVDEAQAAPAHCLAALTAGELGYPGLFIFALLWLRWFQMAATFFWKRSDDPTRRIGVGIFFGFGGIFLQSLTEWVFRQSPIYYVFHILLGTLASLYHLKYHSQRASPIPAVAAELHMEIA
jgi:hypothetical protein